ncbi:MAG: UDP-N-acetylmuramoyl-tripeptide--D-alanyl-D-alanine ligase [Candidatus Paceibacterota bacterium]|jgi:UDP-N-acetylmuramoyl-tripeptide--D-alanyl-D-alanine ligase|nr:UDP-N-acetylmuramoyl-tripeptide--D-alanyl-D-alanine ligase [bacterium]
MLVENWYLALLGIAILLFWIIRQLKANFFWLYLWQLKNYHVGRFLAHFDTESGKKTFGIIFFIKLFFCLTCLSFILCAHFYGFSYEKMPILAQPIWLFIFMASVLIVLESIYSIRAFLLNRIKKAKSTKKIIFLSFIVFAISILFTITIGKNFLIETNIGITDFLYLIFLLYLFDLLTPSIVSMIVLFFQPLTVYLRNKTLILARKKIKSLNNLLTIGITGSYGKSSTKEFLKIILSESFSVVTTVKNQNSEIGISECILREVTSSHEIFICEMGAYSKGGIRLLCKIAQPKIGILTGIGNQHLATFGSQENIISTKFELIENLPKEGLAILNWDSELIRDNFKGDIANLKCSASKHEDIWAEGVKSDEQGLVFEACFKNGQRIKIKSGIIGRHHLSNLLLCIAIAKKIGMSNEEIANGCEKITSDVSGFKVETTKYGFSVINSSYSANKIGVLSHLDQFKDMITSGKKVLVMPCIIELGADGPKTHYEIGRQIAKSCDVAIITTKDYFKDIKKGAQAECMKDYNIICIEDPKKVFDIANQRIDGGILLLEGRSSADLIKKIFEK